jgi:hypothetical protein
MPFDLTTCGLLAYYTTHRPRSEDVWYGPWNSILTTLFPPNQGYVITPQRKPYNEDNATSRMPDFIIEIAKVEGPVLGMRTYSSSKLKTHNIGRISTVFSNKSIIRPTAPSRAVRAIGCTGSQQSVRTGGMASRRTTDKRMGPITGLRRLFSGTIQFMTTRLLLILRLSPLSSTPFKSPRFRLNVRDELVPRYSHRRLH